MKIFTLLLTVVLLKSCGNTQATTSAKNDMLDKQSPSISGIYKVQSLSGFKNVPEELSLEFDVASHKVSGYSGCNHFFGSYTISESSITFASMASTKKMCIEEVNAVEQYMMTALAQINSFSLENDILSLMREDTVLITASEVKSVIIEEGKPFNISYSARSRGTDKLVTFNEGTVTYKQNRTSEPLVKKCNQEEIEQLNNYISVLNLSKLPKLEPPSTSHQFDGALMGRLIIQYDDKKYETIIFDHGNPPTYIANLVSALISISEMD